MVKLQYPVLPIHYESLVKNPKSNLLILAKFLNIEWDESLLNHAELSHDEVFDGLAVGNTLVKRPIETSSTYKWQQILTPEQEKAILEVAGEWNVRGAGGRKFAAGPQARTADHAGLWLRGGRLWGQGFRLLDVPALFLQPGDGAARARSGPRDPVRVDARCVDRSFDRHAFRPRAT